MPEALPTETYRPHRLKQLRDKVLRKKPEITAVVREPTAGGVVFRLQKEPAQDGKTNLQILLIEDSKNRWTIPKGHIEPGETAKQTAKREIGEESGLWHTRVIDWLGKIHFKYRRMDKLVLMTTQVFLVESLDNKEQPTKEKWMRGIKWFDFDEAVDVIEYSDIEKLMLLARRKLRLKHKEGTRE